MSRNPHDLLACPAGYGIHVEEDRMMLVGDSFCQRCFANAGTSYEKYEFTHLILSFSTIRLSAAKPEALLPIIRNKKILITLLLGACVQTSKIRLPGGAGLGRAQELFHYLHEYTYFREKNVEIANSCADPLIWREKGGFGTSTRK
jgi:hypothetical protein